MPEPRTTPRAGGLEAPIRAVCFDWGGTLMVDDGPDGVPMNLWPEVAAVPGARECLTALEGRVGLCGFGLGFTSGWADIVGAGFQPAHQCC